jgi:hypothetical protein
MKNFLTSGLVGSALLIAAAGLPAKATSVTETFDTPPSGWTTDRYAPAVFTSPVVFDGGNRLQESISSADGANNRPAAYSSSFYNTQGMAQTNPAGTIFESIDLYVSSAMLSDPNRVAGIWGVGYDATNTISLYPIVELAGGQFQGWDNGSWVAMGLPSGLVGDQWVTLAMLLDTTADIVTYTVNGELATSVAAYGTEYIGSTILQVINSADGIDRTVYWDNLTRADVAPTPLPAALPLFGSVLVGGGVLTWRRRKAKAV